jgi:D-amino-acid dehydrogenase
VDGRLLAGALLRAAESRGLTVLRTGAERLLIDSGTVAGVVASGEEVRARGVLIAGGAWSPELAGQLGLMLPIAPQRGQIVHLGLPGVATGNWPIITAFHGHYMVPWPDGRVVVGATRETGSGFAPHTTAAGLNEVLSEALRVAPGLAEASIADIRVGLRPATPDSLPVLGAVPGVRNVYIAAGHGATGLQLGPYSGKLMADLLLGNPLQNDISAFSPTRF